MSTFGPLLVLFAALCAAGAILALVLPQAAGPRVVAWFGTLAGLALVVLGVSALFDPAVVTIPLWTIPSVATITLHRDPLAGLFLLVTGLVVIPVSIFGANSLPHLLGRASVRAYAVMYFALVVSIAWILVAGDVFSFMVTWEIMSVLCYLLIVFGSADGRTRYAAYLMLAISEAGALAATLGLLLLASHANSLNFDQIKLFGVTLGAGARLAVFLLTFFGFGVKAGLVPVNSWLPRAYTAAPAPFVPLLAGATLNLGLYGIFRVNADLLPAISAAPGIVALIIGTLSALVGILYATTEDDLKGVLAHSSIENAGIITAGFGAGFVFTAVGKPALAAMAFVVALYHMLNHSVYKTLLFIGSGIVNDRAGTRSLDRLGGLIRTMPLTALGVLIGILSIAALPPFNGFVSEWLTLQTFLRSAEISSLAIKMVFALCGAGLALTAALAVTCFAKVFAMGFLGISRSPAAERATEATMSALAPLAILASLCFLLGVLPTYVISSLDRAVQPLTHTSATAALVPPFFAGSPGHGELPPAFASEFHDIGSQVGQSIAPGPGLVILHRGESANPVVFAVAPTYLLLILAGFLIVLFLVTRGFGTRRRTLTRRAAWDGGIRRLLPEMTYTATGFSNPVRVIFQAIFRPTIVEHTRDTVAQHFRAAISREIVTVHVVDKLILNPAKSGMQYAARFFARMHHGRLNAYVGYVLVSVVVVFAVLIFA